MNWSRGELQGVPTCPACGETKRDAKYYSRRDDQGAMPDVWTLVRCSSCKSVYLDPRPDDVSLPRAYEGYYTHEMDPGDVSGAHSDKLIWRLINGYLNRRFGMSRSPALRIGYWVFALLEPFRLKLDYYGRHISCNRFPNRGNLLDIGCGNGSFLLRAQEMGWQVVGCEPDAGAVKVCESLSLSVVHGDAFNPELSDHRFDVITMSHVIEHVAQPELLLKRASELLKPGGILWMATPNPQSFGIRVFGSASVNLHIPLHLCIPTQETAKKWLIDAGFDDIRYLRRGALSSYYWKGSLRIAKREGISNVFFKLLPVLRVVGDFLATFSTHYVEETVIVARKSNLRHES